MPVFEASARSTLVTATAGAVLFGFKAGSLRARIREIHLFNITAPTTSGALGLNRSTALGTGALTGLVGIPHDPSDSATTAQVITAWATAVPTVVAASTLRRFDSPASFGNGVIWTFDTMDPLVVPAAPAVNAELVFTNLQASAPGTYDFTFVWEE